MNNETIYSWHLNVFDDYSLGTIVVVAMPELHDNFTEVGFFTSDGIKKLNKIFHNEYQYKILDMNKNIQEQKDALEKEIKSKLPIVQ